MQNGSSRRTRVRVVIRTSHVDVSKKSFTMLFRRLLTKCLLVLHDCRNNIAISNLCTHTASVRNTVFALSSGHGRCGVAVIRVSGPACSEAVKSLCRKPALPAPREAVLRRLFDPLTKEVIDKGLVLWFPGPGSFTGEDCAEFHVHGGTSVVTAMLEAMGHLPGLKIAEPGDFTRRAFLNGKMGLTEVEGLSDLIHAETAAQRQQALRQMEGDLGALYRQWREQMLKCLASVEAYIDFSEDENIEADAVVRATEDLQQVVREMDHHLSDNRRGQRLRDGVHVAIIGEPNVGKSSLLNALCQRPAAIVSPLAGTTRDIVETGINLAGYPVLLSDTAGLREAGDVVEREGVRRALDRAFKADLRILVMDSANVLSSKPPQITWSRFIQDHMTSLGLGQMSATHPDRVISQKHAVLGDSVGSEQTSDSVYSTTASGCMHERVNSSRTLSLTSAAVEVVEGQANVVEEQSCIDSGIFRHDSDMLDGAIVVLNKSDLLLEEDRRLLPTADDVGVTVCPVSCVNTNGLDTFVAVLANRVKQLCGDPLAGSPSLTQSRHRSHLTQCLHHLNIFQRRVGSDDLVLAAESVRRAMRELGCVTGAVSVEDVLDVVFKDFCIGK